MALLRPFLTYTYPPNTALAILVLYGMIALVAFCTWSHYHHED